MNLKLEVSIVGPCYRDDSLGFDGCSRDFTVYIVLSDADKVFGEKHEYTLSQTTSKYSSGWSEPFRRVEATIYGRSENLQGLEAKAKMLKKLFAYIEKLPVKPVTLADHVATIAAPHHVGIGQLLVYKDHKTPPEIRDAQAIIARICNEVAKRERDLVPAATAAA